eukprot:GHVH01005292.1.p1 GENE.GHVH01005292.1~~GHVH01005292.1.p1  ORF type:complete len:689 (+),score=106.64 GHVH01005292.1:56-2068(+)
MEDDFYVDDMMEGGVPKMATPFLRPSDPTRGSVNLSADVPPPSSPAFSESFGIIPPVVSGLGISSPPKPAYERVTPASSQKFADNKLVKDSDEWNTSQVYEEFTKLGSNEDIDSQKFHDSFRCPCGFRSDMKSLTHQRWKYLHCLPAYTDESIDQLFDADGQDKANPLSNMSQFLGSEFAMHAKKLKRMKFECHQFNGRVMYTAWQNYEEQYNRLICDLNLDPQPWMSASKSVYCLSLLSQQLFEKVMRNRYFENFLEERSEFGDTTSKLQICQMIVTSLAVRTRLHWSQLANSSFERALIKLALNSKTRSLVYGALPQVPSSFMAILKEGVDHIVLHWRELLSPIIAAIDCCDSKELFKVILSIIQLITVSFPILTPLMVIDVIDLPIDVSQCACQTSHRKDDSLSRDGSFASSNQNCFLGRLMRASRNHQDTSIWLNLLVIFQEFLPNLGHLVESVHEDLDSVRRSALMLDLPLIRLLIGFFKSSHTVGATHRDADLMFNEYSAFAYPFVVSSTSLGAYLEYPNVMALTSGLPIVILKWYLIIFLPIIDTLVKKRTVLLSHVHPSKPKNQDAQSVPMVFLMVRRLLHAFILRKPERSHNAFYNYMLSLMPSLEGTASSIQGDDGYFILDEELMFELRLFVLIMRRTGIIRDDALLQRTDDFITDRLGF